MRKDHGSVQKPPLAAAADKNLGSQSSQRSDECEAPISRKPESNDTKISPVSEEVHLDVPKMFVSDISSMFTGVMASSISVTSPHTKLQRLQTGDGTEPAPQDEEAEEISGSLEEHEHKEGGVHGEEVAPHDEAIPDVRSRGDEAHRPLQMDQQEEGGDGDSHEDQDAYSCGCFGFHPEFLQTFRSRGWVLFILCCASFVRGFAMNGVILVVLPTLERRFHLTGSESGLIVSVSDVASGILTLPVSFMATNRNKPYFVASGISLVGLGNFVLCLAHFIAGSYRQPGLTEETCTLVEKSVTASCAEGSVRHFRFLLMAGQVLSGMGSTPINTVSIAYMDENLPPDVSPTYVGIFNSMAVLGPSGGFIVGGLTLTYYVDITADVKNLGITRKSSSWVGAWWLGILMSASSSVILGAIIIMFPKHLPEYRDLLSEQKKGHLTSHFSVSILRTQDFGQRLSDLPAALKRLCQNQALVFICLAGAFSQLSVIGLTAVTTKFFKSQFGLTSTHAALLIGPLSLGAGVTGAISGGVVVTKMRLESFGVLRLCLFNSFLSLVGISAFWVYCPAVEFARNSNFSSSDNPGNSTYDLPCNSDCHCSEDDTHPVCSADDIVFTSPCYAGCSTPVHTKEAVAYTACTCVNGTTSLPGISGAVSVQAIPSLCTPDCNFLIVYLTGYFVSLGAVCLNMAPSTAAIVRVVKHKQRSLALGLQAIIGRLLGSIPAPVLFGKIVDVSCQVWNKRCGEVGNCIAYYNDKMARGVFFALLACTLTSMLFYMAAAYAFQLHLSRINAFRAKKIEVPEEESQDSK